MHLTRPLLALFEIFRLKNIYIFSLRFSVQSTIKQEKWNHLHFYAYLHESNEKRKYQHFRKKIELTCLLGQVNVVCSRLHFFYSPLSLNTWQYSGICRCLDIKFTVTVEVFKRLFVPFVVSEDRQNRTGSASIFRGLVHVFNLGRVHRYGGEVTWYY